MKPYLPDATAANFDWRAYLASFDGRLLGVGAGRRALCKYDPLLFSLVYLRHHLASDETDGEISFSDLHLDLCRDAIRLAGTTLASDPKLAYIAYRGGGKSTWNFLIIPLWALAHRHRKFIAAFADSGPQAQQHLLSLKQELDNNALLRKDHPSLCRPAKRQSGVTVSDSQSLYVSANNTAFQAKGVDASTLGSKVGDQRPDLILFDDVEPDMSNYSDYQKTKRLDTIVNAILPMNTRAAVTFVGTVTMPGSIMHDIVRTAIEPGADDLASWVAEENVTGRYYPLLKTADDGEAVSAWPERYPSDWCNEQAGSSSFQLNMQNNPRGRDGGYWTADDFVYEEPTDFHTRWILEIDPAVTTKVTSDWTGLAVVACSPARPRLGGAMAFARACVVDSWQVKLVGAKLRKRVLQILEMYPRIKAVRVEVQNGGEYISEALHDLPVKLLSHPSTVSKDVRHSWALDHYQRRRVTHAKRMRILEDEMVAYPQGANDDVSDAACSAILYFLEKPKPIVVSAHSAVYAS